MRFWNATALRSVLKPLRFRIPSSSRQSAIHNEPCFFTVFSFAVSGVATNFLPA